VFRGGVPCEINSNKPLGGLLLVLSVLFGFLGLPESECIWTDDVVELKGL
jgi:hypothetical protein